jgi:Tol biopolymer transport system component
MDGNFEIYTINPDGSGLKRITNNPADSWFPAWSTDGKFIAYSSKRAGSPEIYVVNVDDLSTKRLTFTNGITKYSSWSP